MLAARAVAELFGKRHNNVLRAYAAMECSPEFTALNFELSEYNDASGRKLPVINMTKDGFVFLAMGFNGRCGFIHEGWSELVAAMNDLLKD